MSNFYIYVACLASYDAGYLHGAWIDATQAVEAMYADIDAMFKESPVEGAKEFEIRDDSYGIVDKNDSIEYVHELADFVKEQGRLGIIVMKDTGCFADEVAYLLENSYCGSFGAVVDFVDEFVAKHYTLHDFIRTSLDRDFIWHRLECDGYYAIKVGDEEVHIFDSC